MDLRLKYGRRPQGLAVDLPASKSISNRALIVNALAGGGCELKNVAVCDDTTAMLRALADPAAARVDIGAAGTAMRFLTAYLAMQDGRVATIDGSPRMRQRPVGVLVDALRRCGARIDYAGTEGFPPLRISGRRLRADGPVKINGGISSQYVSALMMVGPLMEGGLTLSVEGELISRPYVEMTAAIMRLFGAAVELDGNLISIPAAAYRPAALTVESDWSAASYWYELKSLLPDLPVRLNGLSAGSLQGDSRVADYFRPFGVTTEFVDGGVELGYSPSAVEKELRLDLSGQPDLAQTIVVAACLCRKPFVVGGLSTLKIKETDRIEALRSQLAKLGYGIAVGADCSLSWDGAAGAPEKEAAIATFDDHRMAMAFAPAAILFPGLVIMKPEVVAKSYPDYWRHLSAAGFELEDAE